MEDNLVVKYEYLITQLVSLNTSFLEVSAYSASVIFRITVYGYKFLCH